MTPDPTYHRARFGHLARAARGVVERLRNADLVALEAYFPTPETKAYYLAHVIETHSCFPRVLDGTMTTDRYAERTDRMRRAILRVTS